MKKLLLATIALMYIMFLVLSRPTHADADIGTLKSTTAADPTVEVNEFNPGEEVYVKGLGLMPNSTYILYIVYDQVNWVLGAGIPSAVPGTLQPTLITDGYGNFGLTLTWASAELGYYDIIADCQDYGNTGQYDVHDSLDDFEVGTAGFFVIPEIPLGTITVLFVCFASILLRRKARP